MLRKSLALSLVASISLYAAGYKIPEQSLNATALSAAYIANSNGADTAYYNPANMVFNANENELDFALMYISLPKVDFNALNVNNSGDSKEESFILPSLHYIFPSDYENVKFGFSFIAPGGLSKRWDESTQKAFAEEFSLEIVEINPSVAYKVSEDFSLAFGLRMLYAKGVVKSSSIASRDMKGDAREYGYNLAMTYKFNNTTRFAATYRSNVDINLEGNAKLHLGSTLVYDAGASVEIPLPASLNLAIGHDYKNFSFEFVYERTYWSKYKNLDFEYDSAIHNSLVSAFDDAKEKNYKDTNTYRLGLIYKYNNRLNLMAGFAIDESPVPSETIGFELPDSDAKIYSLGFKYKINENSSFGMAYLLSDKEDRKVVVKTSSGDIPGEFSNSKAHLLSFAYSYRF